MMSLATKYHWVTANFLRASFRKKPSVYKEGTIETFQYIYLAISFIPAMTENRYEQDFIYLLVESMLLLNNKSAVEAPGKASESTEESRPTSGTPKTGRSEGKKTILSNAVPFEYFQNSILV